MKYFLMFIHHKERTIIFPIVGDEMALVHSLTINHRYFLEYLGETLGLSLRYLKFKNMDLDNWEEEKDKKRKLK